MKNKILIATVLLIASAWGGYVYLHKPSMQEVAINSIDESISYHKKMQEFQSSPLERKINEEIIRELSAIRKDVGKNNPDDINHSTRAGNEAVAILGLISDAGMYIQTEEDLKKWKEKVAKRYKPEHQP